MAMFLEMHDAEEGNTLNGVARNIEYLYQAEQWVIDSARNRHEIVLWLLFDSNGDPLKAWKRGQESFFEIVIPEGTKADPRSLAPKKKPIDPETKLRVLAEMAAGGRNNWVMLYCIPEEREAAEQLVADGIFAFGAHPKGGNIVNVWKLAPEVFDRLIRAGAQNVLRGR